MKKKSLVIVAHPDDETIWMGGTILSSKDTDWTIFSLCRGDDPVRSARFKKACELYGAKGIMSDLEDQGLLNIEKSLPEIKNRVLENFKEEKFDDVFTHGYNGEYGHERHCAVHIAVKELFDENLLSCKKLYFFSYKISQDAINNSDTADLAVELKPEIFKEKTKLIEDLYGFPKKAYEYKLCLPKETFILSGK